MQHALIRPRHPDPTPLPVNAIRPDGGWQR